MTVHSAIHEMFVIERTYAAAPSRVFAAFASEEAKNWGDTGDLEPVDEQQGAEDQRGQRRRANHASSG